MTTTLRRIGHVQGSEHYEVLQETQGNHLAAVGHVERSQLCELRQVEHALIRDVVAARQHHAPQTGHL